MDEFTSNNRWRTAEQNPQRSMSFSTRDLGRLHRWGSRVARSGVGLGLLALANLAACSHEEAAKAPPAGDEPVYASPWDRPIGQRAASSVSSGTPGPAPRNKSLAELMQLGNADAPIAATASPMQVPDAAGFDPESIGKPTADAGKQLAVAGKTQWTIVIVGFDKEREANLAAEALQRVQSAEGLKEAFLEDRGKAVVVAYGQYPAADAPAAKRDLERIRSLQVGGETPFGSAMMAPPIYEALAGTLPQFDLRNVKAQFGDRASYTLQVGVYCRMDEVEPSAKELGEFRAAAEKAVIEMRRQGDQAFYYHGPRRSMVTVGLFGLNEFDSKNPGAQSPVIAQVVRKFPYNLVNGAGVKRRRPGHVEPTMDPSFVVAVP